MADKFFHLNRRLWKNYQSNGIMLEIMLLEINFLDVRRNCPTVHESHQRPHPHIRKP